MLLEGNPNPPPIFVPPPIKRPYLFFQVESLPEHQSPFYAYSPPIWDDLNIGIPWPFDGIKFSVRFLPLRLIHLSFAGNFVFLKKSVKICISNGHSSALSVTLCPYQATNYNHGCFI